jgi:probable FeS assembly SUF system protein SufT
MLHEEIVLKRDIPATLIPAGDEVVLPEGTEMHVTQALGGAITVRAKSGLFRIDRQHIDALGEEVARSTAAAEEEVSGDFGEELVWTALRSCYEPEIPINIVDLGLIYDLSIEPRAAGRFFVGVKMTLTAQGCGMGPVIAEDAKTKIEALPQVEAAQVDIVWDPVWNPQMISEEGKKTLGLT